MQQVIRHRITVLTLLLAVVPAVFTSCENTRPDITVTFESDARSVRDALMGMSQSLADRMALMEAAMESGLADYQAALSQMRQAVDSLGGSLEEKLAAVTEVVKLQGTSLDAKLALIEAAAAAGFAAGKTQQALLQEAVAALEGTEAEKLAALETAVKNQGAGFETRMGLIEASVREGLADQVAAQALLKETLETLGGSMEQKLAAIDTALVSQQASLASKLALIETAVQEGFAGERTQDTLIARALDSLMGGEDEKLAALAETMESQLPGLEAKLELIEAAAERQFVDEQATINLLQKALTSLRGTAEGIDARIDAVVSMLGTVDPTTGSVADLLAAIRTDVSVIPDIETQIAAIENLVKQMDIMPIEFTDFVKDNVLVIGDTTLRVPYSLSATGVDVAASSSDQNMVVSAVPDPVNPLKGYLEIVKVWDDKDTTPKKVEVTLSNQFKSETYMLEVVKDQMVDPTGGQDLTLNYEGKKLDGTTGPFEFHYTTNTPTIVTVPDSAKWIHLVYDTEGNGSTTDSVIRIMVDPNKGFYARKAGVKVTNHVSRNALTFSIYQDYNKEEIAFSADNSSLKTAFVLDTKHINFNKDGIISKAEAAAVTSLDSLFGPGLYNGQLDGHKCEYTSFDEFQYFTGIDTIPAGSFHNWVNLTSITLPSSITTIEGGHDGLDGPFTECPKLEAIKGPFTVNDQMLVYNKQLLKVAETTTSVTIPAGVEIIGTKAFYKSNIKSITIPSSVKKIRDHAFEYSQVETVAFAMTGTDPKTATAYVDSLAENSFVHCFKLKTFKGPENGTSTVRVTRDRLCLCRDTTLYAFAMGSGLVDYAIPESAGVKKLAAYVFSAQPSTSSEDPDPSAVQWQRIGLPSTLTHIGDHAFSFQKATPKMEVFFKGENPPKADAGVFDNTSTKRLMVPPVKNGDQVDLVATNARGKDFEKAMGDYVYQSPSYYPVWPFAEGIPMVATIAAKQGYVCESNPGSSIPGQWSDLGQDTVAVLYTVEGVNKRAHARVAAVDANGVATISFVVDYKTMNVASNIDCQLVYPPRAVNDANTGPKDYKDMSDSQTGDKSKALDVQVGSGSFNTAGTPSLTINTPLHPIYSLFIIKLNSGNETELSVKDKDNNSVVTMDARLGVHGRDTYYFSMPASNTNSIYHISGSKGQCSISVPTSSSYTQPTPLGYVFPFTVTLQ